MNVFDFVAGTGMDMVVQLFGDAVCIRLRSRGIYKEEALGVFFGEPPAKMEWEG